MQVGVSKARQLSRHHNLPLLGVHHMEGHALVARLPPAAAATTVPVIDCTRGEGAATAVAANRGTGSSTSGSNGTATTATSTTTTTTTTTASGGAAAVVLGTPGQVMVPGGREAAEFPFLCLLVSGGHNLLLLVRGVGQYMQLGTTLDDALGKVQEEGSGGGGKGLGQACGVGQGRRAVHAAGHDVGRGAESGTMGVGL